MYIYEYTYILSRNDYHKIFLQAAGLAHHQRCLECQIRQPLRCHLQNLTHLIHGNMPRLPDQNNICFAMPGGLLSRQGFQNHPAPHEICSIHILALV